MRCCAIFRHHQLTTPRFLTVDRRSGGNGRDKNSLRSAHKNRFFSTFALANGLVAQLEERLNGIEEVVSSNLIGSTNLLIDNKLRNILRCVFDGPYGVHETRDYRRMVARPYQPLSPSNKDIRTHAETVPERLHVRRGQAAFTLQDSVGDRTVDIKDSG
jgi:hypothetical protein